jgi:protein subunit release factor A
MTNVQNRVTDHRGFKVNDLRGCMEGGSLQELMDGVAKALQQMELEDAISQDTEESLDVI